MKHETGNQESGMERGASVTGFADLKTIAAELDFPLTTLTSLLPEEIREIMDRDGGSGRWRYHRKYLPAIREMLTQTNEAGKRAVKPGTAALFLRPRIEAINSGMGLVENEKQETRNALQEKSSAPDSAAQLVSLENARELVVAIAKMSQVGIQALPPDKLLTKDEAIAEFGVSAATLQKIRHLREGRSVKWNRSDISVYVASRFS